MPEFCSASSNAAPEEQNIRTQLLQGPHELTITQQKTQRPTTNQTFDPRPGDATNAP